LIRQHVGDDPAAGELREHVGGVGLERDRPRLSRPAALFDARERLVQRSDALVHVPRAQPALNPIRVDFDDKGDPFVHGDRQRLGATHAAETGGDDEAAGQGASEVTAAQFRERLVRALQDALRSYIDPAAGRHLAVHRQALVLEVPECVPGGPGRNQHAVHYQYARGPGMRAEDRDRLAGLDEECLIMVQSPQRVDDDVERGPGPGGSS
jgi:hypothetical protein